MDFAISCSLFLAALIYGVSSGTGVLFPLGLGLLLFSAVGIYRGHSVGGVLRMIGGSAAKVAVVLRVFVLIGMITAVWRASGTVPFFVYYGVSLVEPRFFILTAFLLTCLTSLLIGSSIGAAGTMGVVLMIIAGSGGADIPMTAGAIVAGIYFGDRGAPTSSGANLVAVLTGTRVLDNVRNMFRSAFVPLLISAGVYLALSMRSGMSRADVSLLSEISELYDIGAVTALPALVLVVMCVLKCNVLLSMLMSVLCGIVTAILVQGAGFYELVGYMLMGYEPLVPSNRFAEIIAGGGVAEMWGVMVTVLISSAYSGIFEGTGVLADVKDFLSRSARRTKRLGSVFPVTLLAASLTAALGCTQTVSIILTHHLMRGVYGETGLSDSALALDIEDSSVVVAALIPWNVALSVPMIMLSVGAECIPYAVFLYILPLWRLFRGLGLRPEAGLRPRRRRG